MLSFFSNKLDFIAFVGYDIHAVDSFRQEGGDFVEIFVTFILSVLAGVAANYICKWLDGDDDSPNPPDCLR